MGAGAQAGGWRLAAQATGQQHKTSASDALLLQKRRGARTLWVREASRAAHSAEGAPLLQADAILNVDRQRTHCDSPVVGARSGATAETPFSVSLRFAATCKSSAFNSSSLLGPRARRLRVADMLDSTLSAGRRSGGVQADEVRCQARNVFAHCPSGGLNLGRSTEVHCPVLTSLRIFHC